MEGTPSIWFLDERPSRTGRVRDPDAGKLRGAGEGRVIVCVACRGRVTDASCRVDVDGDHEHTFFNPAGFIYRVVCFSSVPGCRAVGPATDEFTWFAGHHWQFAVCVGCGTHLGWHFDGPTHFAALIEGRIAEKEAKR